MDSRKKVTISWSGGKDSALALYHILNNEQYEVVNLHTIFSSETRRVGLHGTHELLIDRQAEMCGLKLVKTYLQGQGDSHEYERAVKKLYLEMKEDGITHVVFGDIFLGDLKVYRELLLQDSGLQPLFPLWGLGSESIVRKFISLGFRTIICACNEECYSAGLLGNELDNRALMKLPGKTDACGENGEFHTFVFDAPYFKGPIPLRKGGEVSREYVYNVESESGKEQKRSVFHFCDILA